MPLIADKMFILNVTISVKLPPNSGYLLITDKFFKTVGVRYPEVSLFKETVPENPLL